MAYANQDDYIAWLKGRGNTIPLAEFEFWANRASEHIDSATFDRLYDEEVFEEYEMQIVSVTCELAEILYSANTSGEKVLSSMSIGSYSESYVRQDKEEVRKRIDGVLRRGLALTGLLFRG